MKLNAVKAMLITSIIIIFLYIIGLIIPIIKNSKDVKFIHSYKIEYII